MTGMQRNTDTDTDVNDASAEFERFRQAGDDFLGDDDRIVFSGHVWQHHHELIAPLPRHGVGAAYASAQTHRGLIEQLVAQAVPQCVVDLFETVKIGKHQRYLPIVSARLLEGLRQPFVQQAPVRQPGQWIVVSAVENLLLGLLARGDVVEKGHILHNASFRGTHRRNGFPNGIDFTVLTTLP